jgi:predicted nucleic acid-binding protein
MVRIYLDLCCFNRPYDSQFQTRIRLETAAKMRIQEMIKNKEMSLVWSYMLDLENHQNPDKERMAEIYSWYDLSSLYIMGNQEILNLGMEIQKIGIKRKDSLHIASAIKGECNYFLTTDDGILKYKDKIKKTQIFNPVDLILFQEQSYEK